MDSFKKFIKDFRRSSKTSLVDSKKEAQNDVNSVAAFIVSEQQKEQQNIMMRQHEFRVSQQATCQRDHEYARLLEQQQLLQQQTIQAEERRVQLALQQEQERQRLKMEQAREWLRQENVQAQLRNAERLNQAHERALQMESHAQETGRDLAMFMISLDSLNSDGHIFTSANIAILEKMLLNAEFQKRWISKIDSILDVDQRKPVDRWMRFMSLRCHPDKHPYNKEGWTHIMHIITVTRERAHHLN